MVHVEAETTIACSLNHLVVHIVGGVLDTRVEVEACKADFLATDDWVLLSALEFNHPIVLSTIFAFLEINDSVRILCLEQQFPPSRRVKNESVERAIVFRKIEIVAIDVWMSKAAERECVFYLTFAVSNVCEFFLGADAAEPRAGWILSVIM